MIVSHGLSDVGCVRPSNEDRFLIDDQFRLYVVADGMGGHRHGELAAELAISTLKYYIESSHDRTDVSWPFGYEFALSVDSNRLATAIQLANRQVWKRAEEKPECVGMGTTIAAVLIDGAHAAIANVGDSRVYRYRAGELEQISTDDTWINKLRERGEPTVQFQNHPMRNVLTQAAGSNSDIVAHSLDLELQGGDLLLLCSDGLHGVVPASELRDYLATGGPLPELGTRLIEAARTRGAPDNVTCILLSFTD